MNRHFLSAIALFAVAFAAGSTAVAHTVWIEPKDGKLVIRFAEPGDNFETSPGYLDALSAPVGFVVGAGTNLAVASPKQADCFLLDGASPAKAACVETTFTVRGGRKPIFYARWQPSGAGAATPSLDLDIVPTGKPGEARVYFRGKELGGVAATLRGPDDKEQKLTADAEGYLRFKTEQSGPYLLTVPHYRESLAGYYGGVAYKETSHNAALSWVQP